MPLDLLASYAAVAGFAAAMVVAAVSDLTTMTIPNYLTIALGCAFPALSWLAGWPPEAIAFSLAAALVAFFAFVALFALGLMGGGDGKILTVGILWLGAEHAMDFVLLTLMLGGVCAVILIVYRKLRLPSRWQDIPWLVQLHHPATGIPYAVAIGSAGLIVLPHTFWAQVIA